MKAITVEPGKALSVAWEDVPEPDARQGSVLVESVAVGICGTDLEITTGKYGWAPPGQTRLVLGHESLGRVLDPGPVSGLQKGDLVAGIVRRPDPVPCPSCAVGEWDMCRNGRYTERGIKASDGFMSERWRIEPEYAIKLDRSLGLLGVLLEPTTVVVKAWEHIFAVGNRAFWEPKTVLVTGAGPIGLLGALIGKQLGMDVHVLDRINTGTKPELARALGASYHTGDIRDIGFEPDVILECTGVASLISEAVSLLAPSGVLCLAGIGHRGAIEIPMTGNWVLKNKVVLGSVNANKRHWFKAGEALARADRSWLTRLITRRERPESYAKTLERRPDDIKVIVQFIEIENGADRFKA